MCLRQVCVLACAASAFTACHSAGNPKGPVDAAVGGGGEEGDATDGATAVGSGGAGGTTAGGTTAGGTTAGGIGGIGGTTGIGGNTAGATGGTGASDGAVALDATEVCRAAVQAQCERDAFCLLQPIGFLQDCFALADLCPDYYFSADSNRVVADIGACVDKVSARSCTDIPLFVYPSCLVPGKRPAGAGCAFSSQCQSGLCSGSGDPCKTCSALPAAGTKCPDSGRCQLGTFCHPTTRLCTDVGTIVHAAQGQPCDLSASPLVGCADDLLCVRATYDSPAGTCTPRRVAGESCTTLIDGSEGCAAGTECTDSTGGTCELPGTCGVGARCDAASYCRTGDGGFTCAPFATAGQPCSTSSSDGLPPCLQPAVCMATTGTCVLPRDWGENCDANHPCDKPLTCITGFCEKLGALSCPP